MIAGEPRVTPGGTPAGLDSGAAKSEKQNLSAHNPVAVRAPSTIADIPVPRPQGHEFAALTPVKIAP